eukprot:TRINITY_DN14828_c0_g1_i3.p1 TRINITY_DN14828_c0_g1~~TRINITY_DN14828_c0_g1_i3.p1  ORF type:complete len:487 (+),score=115.40 TRINITY_DN14828_c0_g1_i3:66-1526(+)
MSERSGCLRLSRDSLCWRPYLAADEHAAANKATRSRTRRRSSDASDEGSISGSGSEQGSDAEGSDEEADEKGEKEAEWEADSDSDDDGPPPLDTTTLANNTPARSALLRPLPLTRPTSTASQRAPSLLPTSPQRRHRQAKANKTHRRMAPDHLSLFIKMSEVEQLRWGRVGDGDLVDLMDLLNPAALETTSTPNVSNKQQQIQQDADLAKLVATRRAMAFNMAGETAGAVGSPAQRGGELELQHGGAPRDKDKDRPRLYYISITAGQVYKFFPFLASEVKELLLALSDLSQVKTLDEARFMTTILSSSLGQLRHQMLLELLSEGRLSGKSPWISNTEWLFSVLGSLTDENAPQRLLDLERLYHSCRLNKEVTKETLKALQHLWGNSNSETVRVKVLQVVERLMDKSIMFVSEPYFASTVRWLADIESRLDPYKSSQAQKMLSDLRRLVTEIRQQPMRIISHNQIPIVFHNLPQLYRYRRQMCGELA